MTGVMTRAALICVLATVPLAACGVKGDPLPVTQEDR